MRFATCFLKEGCLQCRERRNALCGQKRGCLCSKERREMLDLIELKDTLGKMPCTAVGGCRNSEEGSGCGGHERAMKALEVLDKADNYLNFLLAPISGDGRDWLILGALIQVAKELGYPTLQVFSGIDVTKVILHDGKYKDFSGYAASDLQALYNAILAAVKEQK